MSSAIIAVRPYSGACASSRRCSPTGVKLRHRSRHRKRTARRRQMPSSPRRLPAPASYSPRPADRETRQILHVQRPPAAQVGDVAASTTEFRHEVLLLASARRRRAAPAVPSPTAHPPPGRSLNATVRRALTGCCVGQHPDTGQAAAIRRVDLAERDVQVATLLARPAIHQPDARARIRRSKPIRSAAFAHPFTLTCLVKLSQRAARKITSSSSGRSPPPARTRAATLGIGSAPANYSHFAPVAATGLLVASNTPLQQVRLTLRGRPQQRRRCVKSRSRWA